VDGRSRLPGRGERLVDTALDGGGERRSRLDPVVKRPSTTEAERLVAMCVRLRCMRVTECHVAAIVSTRARRSGDSLRQPLELPAGLDLLVEMCGTECFQLDELGLRVAPASEHRGVAGDQLLWPRRRRAQLRRRPRRPGR